MIDWLQKNLPKGSIALPCIALATAIFGFFREALIAFYFGASADLDAFLIALSIPKLIATQSLIMLGVAIVPHYVHLRESGYTDRSAMLARSWIMLSGGGALLLVLVLWLVSTPLIKILGPGLSDTATKNAANWFVAILPYTWILVVASSLKGILDSNKRFVPAASSNLFVNTAVIIACAVLARRIGISAIAVGLVSGAAVSLVWQMATAIRVEPLIFSIRKQIFSAAGLPFASAGLLIVGSIANQMRVIFDRWFASGMDSGSIAALNYAETLTALPSSIFSMAIATVLLPSFAALVSQKKRQEAYRLCLRWVVIVGLITLLPSLLLIIFREEIVTLVFQRGAFGRTATEMTSSVLLVLPIMIVLTSVSLILNRLFIAIGKTKWIASLAVLSLTVKVLLNVAWATTHGILGLAMATVVSALLVTGIRVVILWRLCKKTS